MDIAGNSLNKLEEPLSWSWSVSDVVNWIGNTLNMAQYKVRYNGKINLDTRLIDMISNLNYQKH